MTVVAEVRGYVSQESGDSPGRRVQDRGLHGWRNQPCPLLGPGPLASRTARP